MSWQRVNRRAESNRLLPEQRPRLAVRLASHSSPCPARGGLTLIELLISITILATLAGLFLGASNSAMESARKARTKTTISKIHSLLMERWDDYSTRRVDINRNLEDSITANFPDSGERGAAMADVRLLALRELLKLELPDRWSDIDLMNAYNYPVSREGAFVQSVPVISQAYFRRRQAVINGLTSGASPLSLQDATDRLNDNGSAECLYMVVMLFTGDGEARTLFSQQDIGDTDEDGAPEFLDGWGRPIRWIRWPAGFVARSPLMTGNPQLEPDPFDPFRRNAIDVRPPANSFPGSLVNYVAHLRGTDGPNRAVGYRLIPLIFSSGPDGIGDMSSRINDILSDSTVRETALDPYDWDEEFNAYEFGSFGDNPANPDGDDNSLDNIHNHQLDGR